MWDVFKKRNEQRLKEEAQRKKIAHSQLILLEAATTTADAAHHVTAQLKRHLEESLLQFESTVRLLFDALIVCDAKGTVKAFNPAAEQIFLCNATDIIHHSVTSLFLLDGVVPADQTSLWDAFQSEKDGISPCATLKGLRASGEVFPIETTMTRLDRSDGSSVVLMLVRDMSTIVASNRAIETHSQRYHSLFDLTFDGILIVQNEQVVAANSAASCIFDKNAASLLATPFSELISNTHILNPSKDVVPPIEAETTRKDGTIVQLLLSSAVITWNDETARLITIKDIGQLKQFEVELRKKEFGKDLIVCFDSRYAITFANTLYCNYYGLTRSQIIGKNITDIFAENDTLMLRLNNLSENNPTQRSKIYARHLDGAIHLQDWVDHVCYDSGNIVEYQCTGRDITDILPRAE